MKIVWASLTSLEDGFNAYAENLTQHLDEVSRPETEIELLGSPRGVAGNYRPFKFLDEAAHVKEFVRLRQRDDVDALAIGCSFDGGLREAREALSIPVLGYTETALLTSQFVSDNVAIIAGTEKFAPIFEEKLRIYGLEDRVLDIYTPNQDSRYLESLGNAFEDDAARANVVEEFDDIAKRCAEDGAELILPGGGALPILLNHMEGVSELQGIPVMDASAVLVRLTETLIDLYELGAVSTSRKRMYRGPPDDFRKELEDLYNI
ncbi:aspartate/glutamate racemase family protein [Natrialbaceae archaeon A-CW1-1]